MGLQAGTILNNRYRIVRSLAQGGFGAMYRAWDTILDRPCAIKENLDVSPEAQRQFLLEAKILANLAHPNLPRVTDYFFIQGQYLVMDFVEGRDLQEILEDRGVPLSEDRVLPWIEQVCDALSYLHSQKPPVIHRDIKPANIKITPSGQALLVDFGIAKVYDPNLKTTVGAQAITPGFSPIEQYGKGSTDPRSDVYALGATLYTLLTGQEPPESVQRAVRDSLTPPRRQIPGLSQRTDSALMRALQIDPDQRFQSAADFKAALMVPEQAPRPVHAAAQIPAPRSIPWPLIGAIFFLSLVSGGVISLLLSGNANRGNFALTQTPLVALPDLSTSPPSPAFLPVTPTVTDTPQSSTTPLIYTVQLGDTCSGIAYDYGVSLESIVELNGLPPDCGVLFAGQQLLIPAHGLPNSDEPVLAVSQIPSKPIATEIASADGMVMVYIPEGEFLMGAADTDPVAGDDEKPQHRVYLDAFWIDLTEVTNAMYALCEGAGACQPPDTSKSRTRLFYYGDSRYGDYPVIHVSWGDADAYCRWAGRRLPSEAEWEKAARGPEGHLYPWGDADPNPGLANFNNQVGDTTAVGRYPDGASPYGVLDMAGNVAEWVADWYNENYYSVTTADNPIGPDSGTYRVLRGGSWFNPTRAVRVTFRLWNYPELRFESSGFRCAR